jgi:uridine phosphorylase
MGNTERSKANDQLDSSVTRTNLQRTKLAHTRPYPPSDLPIDEDGRIYHLQVKPDQIAPDILLVGDPGRAELFGSTFLHDIEIEHEHRGLVTVTGTAKITGNKATVISPLRTTVMTTGMGTPSLEIVVNELIALNEIDFETRTRKPNYPRLHVIRLGSSGGLQETTPLSSPIITTYAIGLDNTGLFYEAPYPDETCRRLEDELGPFLSNAMNAKSRYYGKIHPYVARAEPILVNALMEASQSLGLKAKAGLTVSAPGFFAPEGREISRLGSSLPEIDKIFSKFDPKVVDQRVENVEMESSFLLHLLGGLEYWAGSICTLIGNRLFNTFSTQYEQAVLNAGKVALLALATLRERYPDARIEG